MFLTKQFNTEIDRETARRVRDKCRELDIRIGHFIRSIIVPESIEDLYQGEDLDFRGIPKAIPVHPERNRNDDVISVRMSEAEHEVLTRYALNGELTRSELIRILISKMLDDPSLPMIVEREDWQIERRCRELRAMIHDRKGSKP